jgi:CsoR family transcriptional regulator, copper-sensing transcriptional repressor
MPVKPSSTPHTTPTQKPPALPLPTPSSAPDNYPGAISSIPTESQGHTHSHDPHSREPHSREPHHHQPDQPHVHSEESLKRVVNRLARIEGHIRGIKTMVQDNRPCPEVLIQIAAVRGGLDRVARIILDEHLSECITRAVDEGNIEAEVEALKAALDRFI